MSVIVVGLEQRLSPLELVERAAVAERDLPKALGRCATSRTCPKWSSSRPACGPRCTQWSSASTTGSTR